MPNLLAITVISGGVLLGRQWRHDSETLFLLCLRRACRDRAIDCRLVAANESSSHSSSTHVGFSAFFVFCCFMSLWWIVFLTVHLELNGHTMVVHGSVILVPTETTESLRQIDRLCDGCGKQREQNCSSTFRRDAQALGTWRQCANPSADVKNS